jgi:hypothetical protein
MKRRAFLTSLMISLALFGIAFVAPTPTQAASLDCNDIGGLSGVYGSGAFLGIVGTFAPGDYAVFTVTLNTATMGSFSIIGDADLDPVLAGPTSIPGTLTYTVTGPLPSGAVGIGFYINSADGLVNVRSAQRSPRPR